MLQRGTQEVHIEIRGDHHQWLVNVAESSGARRTYTFSSYSEVIAVVLEELAVYWGKEGTVS